MASLLKPLQPILNKATFLKSTSARSAGWVIFSFGGQQGIRFISNLILTRLLIPEYFGIMAIVNSLSLGVHLFSDIGVQQNIVQSKHGEEPGFLNTAWTLQIIRGFCVFIILAIASWPIALFYDEPILIPITILIGLSNFIGSFESTKIWLLNRNLKLGWFSSLQFINRLFAVIFMIIWALISPTVWALPAGAIVGSIARVAISHFFLPGPNNKIEWRDEYKSEIFSFGRWVMLATSTMFLSEQADKFILAKLLTFSMVGVYTIALSLAEVPRQVVKRLNSLVIFPVVSRNADLPRATLRAKILQKRKLILLGFVVGLPLGIAFGDLLISTLYDERYADATWMFSLLCLGIWFSVLFYTATPCLMGLGKPEYNAHGNLARLFTVLIGIPLGNYLFGTVGVITALSMKDLPAYLAIQQGLFQEKLHFHRQDLLFTALLVTFTLICLAARYGMGLGTPFDVLLS